MPEYIKYVLERAGRISSSEFVEKFLEFKREHGELDFVNGYCIALDEVTRALIEDEEEVFDFLLRVFKYGDKNVAIREACMIESKTGWT